MCYYFPVNKAEEIASHLEWLAPPGKYTKLICGRNFFAAIYYKRRYIRIKEFPINEQINDKELRVIDENGQMLGILSAAKAKEISAAKELDLVKVSPDAKPPVCRILDYGKYRYEQSKREKESKKNQNVTEIKEMRTSCRVQDHDLEVKVKNVQKFISEGNKVKISVRFRGREMTYIEDGRTLLLKIKDLLGDTCVIDKEPKIEGRNYVMFVAPAGSKK